MTLSISKPLQGFGGKEATSSLQNAIKLTTYKHSVYCIAGMTNLITSLNLHANQAITQYVKNVFNIY